MGKLIARLTKENAPEILQKDDISLEWLKNEESTMECNEELEYT
jgi:hypothetical protein